MPGRGTLKRRVLGLLKTSSTRCEEGAQGQARQGAQAKKPTKAELAEIRKAERLARDQENAQKFSSLTAAATPGGVQDFAMKPPPPPPSTRKPPPPPSTTTQPPKATQDPTGPETGRPPRWTDAFVAGPLTHP